MALKQILLSGIWVSLGVLLGRLAGFVREASIANTFGATSVADIVILSLSVPDIMVNLLVAGGLSAALIPEFKSISSEKTGSLFIQASISMGLFFSLIAFTLVYFSHEVASYFAPGFNIETINKTSEVLGIVLWLIPLTVLAGISTACLQSVNHFFIPAMGTLIFNVCLVIGLLGYVKDETDLTVFVWFVILGGMIRWTSQLTVLRYKIQIRDVFRSWMIHTALIKRYLQAVIALGVLTMFPIVARAFASFQGEGGVAMTNYAMKLVELPLGVVISILAVVLFPRLASAFKNNNQQLFQKMAEEGIFWSTVLALIIMGCVLSAPDSFVRLVYGWGNVQQQQLEIVTAILTIAVMSLPIQAAITMYVSMHNARKNTIIPLISSLIGLLFLIPLSWYFESKQGLSGVMVALVLAYIVVLFSMLLMSGVDKFSYINVRELLIKILVLGGFGFFFVISIMMFFKTMFHNDLLILIVEMVLSLVVLMFIVFIVPEYREKVLSYRK